MKLKVGDRVYATNYGKVTAVYVIDRLTKTTAVSKNGHKFKIDYGDSGWINDVGADKWDRNSYYIETQELRIQYFRQLAYMKIKDADLTNLTITQLKAILDIIEKPEEK